MQTLKLQALPRNDKQPTSILCNDNKGSTIAKIWRDKTITINGEDISPHEIEQIIAVQQNFDLFYENVRSEVTAYTKERPHNSFVCSSGQHINGDPLQSTIDPSKWTTQQALASRLEVSRQAVQNWITRGKIKTLYIPEWNHTTLVDAAFNNLKTQE